MLLPRHFQLIVHRHLRSAMWRAALVVALLSHPALAESASDVQHTPHAALAAAVRADMQYLAGDALQGRGSGTSSENAAARYVAEQLRESGVEPAARDGGYVEQINLDAEVASAPPILRFRVGQGEVQWTHGKEFVAARLAQPELSGPLQKIDARSAAELPPPQPGAMVFLRPRTGHGAAPAWRQAYDLVARGAAAVLFPRQGESAWRWHSNALPKLPQKLASAGQAGGLGGNLTELLLTPEAARQIAALPDGIVIRLQAPVKPHRAFTWNAVGKLTGSDPQLREQAVVLSAHLDHLGIGPEVNGRSVYFGADDDASGVTAVLELARALAAGPRPRRTVIFAFFGSEEDGGLGSTYFRENPPVPLDHMVADLEFEMLGRPDKAIPAGSLWLTGFERSDLGPALDAHRAPLVPDPHREQNFFERSDNYVLARKGVVAQTISSYGLHKDYHRPTDDLARIDFDHLTAAISCMIEPITWLVNSDFRPRWTAEGKP